MEITRCPVCAGEGEGEGRRAVSGPGDEDRSRAGSRVAKGQLSVQS